jgi:hypothetical protein
MSAADMGEPALAGSGVPQKKRSSKSKGSSGGKKKKQKSGFVGPDFLPTDRPTPPVLSAMNLAVRPDLEAKSSTGVKLLKTRKNLGRATKVDVSTIVPRNYFFEKFYIFYFNNSDRKCSD